MRNLFGGSDSSSSARGADAGRVPRHSSGWKELLKHLRTQESLRILDIGPTSSTNINYITSLGHSIYMANLVEEASKPEWLIPGEAGEAAYVSMSIVFSRTISISPAATSTSSFSGTRQTIFPSLCWSPSSPASMRLCNLVA